MFNINCTRRSIFFVCLVDCSNLRLVRNWVKIIILMVRCLVCQLLYTGHLWIKYKTDNLNWFPFHYQTSSNLRLVRNWVKIIILMVRCLVCQLLYTGHLWIKYKTDNLNWFPFHYQTRIFLLYMLLHSKVLPSLIS